MGLTVQKRNGELEIFLPQKIKVAVGKAMERVSAVGDFLPSDISETVAAILRSDSSREVVSVDEVHRLVENALMSSKRYDIAREYITYRDRHKPDIFRKREAYKPFDYPHLAQYGTAIHNAFWVHTHFNYQGDAQDYHIVLTDAEREMVRRAMLAISQVEVKVKKFWGKIGDRMPKPEIEEVGAVFSDSEVRHANAYAALLELLGLNKDFEALLEIPVMKKRLAYINKSMAGTNSEDIGEWIETLMFFSMFIENVSLFTQFLIISTVNKEKSALKGMANAIAATSLEENLHYMFGAELVNILREERPHIFTAELESRVYELVHESYEAEKEVVLWMLEEGEPEYFTTNDLLEYIKSRYNKSLLGCGFKAIFEVDDKAIEKFSWFELQTNATTHTDFFIKRPPNYTIGQQSFGADNLF